MKMNTDKLSGTTITKLEIIAQDARRMAKQARKQFATPSVEQDAAFEDAESKLRNVIDEMQTRLGSTDLGTLSERALQAEIGDSYGVLGGLFRDWNKFEEAASLYHEGRKCEARVAALGGKSNSYCLVQELVNRLLSNPSRLRDLEFMGLLAQARNEVQLQMDTDRPKDIWAKADLALLYLLLSPEESIQQWDEFDDLSPPQFACDNTLEVVRTLFERLGDQIKERDKVNWTDTIHRLHHCVRS
jgi:hypothetical protein